MDEAPQAIVREKEMDKMSKESIEELKAIARTIRSRTVMTSATRKFHTWFLSIVHRDIDLYLLERTED